MSTNVKTEENGLLLLDSNVFAALSRKKYYDHFIEKLANCDSDKGERLLRALTNNLLITAPVLLLEYFSFPIKKINSSVEAFIKQEQIKLGIICILEPHIPVWEKSEKDSDAYVNILSHVFKDIVQYLFEELLSHLGNDPEFDADSILLRLKREIKDPSSIYTFQQDYASNEILSNGTNKLVRLVAIDGLLRYGSIHIEGIYACDLKLIKYFKSYISHTIFNLFNDKKENIGFYRDINEIFYRYPKLSLSVGRLSPHTDMLDSYIVHGLACGWFDKDGNLSSFDVLTQDGHDILEMRVAQYQLFFANAEFMRNNSSSDMYKKIMHDLCPGTMYTWNNQTRELKYTNLAQAVRNDTGYSHHNGSTILLCGLEKIPTHVEEPSHP